MAKRIGILGGISHASTIKYYEYIIKKYYARKRDYHYPEIVIFSLDLKRLTEYEDEKDLDGYIKYLMTGIKSLEKAGAEFIVIAANSPHSVFDVLENLATVPMLSIVEAAAQRAQDRGMKKLLLTGIKFTMQESFYQEVFRSYGMEVITPTDKEQDIINRIIFNELVLGIFKDSSRDNLLKIIENYDEDGVILGCTELPLILNQEDTDKKLLNTLELHARAALDFALSE